jgi:hypothetical protein
MHTAVREVTNSLRALLQVAQPLRRRMWPDEGTSSGFIHYERDTGCRPGVQRVPGRHERLGLLEMEMNLVGVRSHFVIHAACAGVCFQRCNIM